MVDAVVRRIEEEEAAAVQARLRHQADAQADIQHFLAQQQQLKKRCVGLAESQFRGRVAAVSGPTACVCGWIFPVCARLSEWCCKCCLRVQAV